LELDSSFIEDEGIEYRRKIFQPFDTFEEFYNKFIENFKSSSEEYYLENIQFKEKYLHSRRFCGYCLIKKV